MNVPEIRWLKQDTLLKPYQSIIQKRVSKRMIKAFDLSPSSGMLSDYCNNHLYYGWHRDENGWIFREWAPHASKIFLIGDFNQWKENNLFELKHTGNGNWEIRLPASSIKHGDLHKLLIYWHTGHGERLPAYANRVVQNEQTKIFTAQVWAPSPYQWEHALFKPSKDTLIYEAHIGMAGDAEKVSGFDDFRIHVLPRIQALGYKIIQLMAIQEHPYYGSFGYQVANFYAVSSRFGTPEALKALIDAAHGMGIAVIMDLVHSHAVKNEAEGLSLFDGTVETYFHAGAQGNHPAWDSKCFNYGKNEVIAFLLSNIKYWLEEFHFDGFRFDGVTSMLYFDHGLGQDFVDYSMYFDGNQDEDAMTYLALANKVVKEINPHAITIAEEVSGMPGLCAPLNDGGMGFDYRMSMGIADYWIRLIKEQPDECWSMGTLFYELTNKRAEERTISYAECHDQALVGDQTIIFRLIGKEMYTAMNLNSNNLLVDRGIALHKMIRLLTLSCARDGYLNFMGNEFGHPEWIDFPREGNQWSYQYARRQWHLADDRHLRYHKLEAFDKAMIHVANNYHIFSTIPQCISCNEQDKILTVQRGKLIFVYNFHPQHSYSDYELEIKPGQYQLLLDSDAVTFNGFNRIEKSQTYFTSFISEKHLLKLYIPSRAALVLLKIEE